MYCNLLYVRGAIHCWGLQLGNGTLSAAALGMVKIPEERWPDSSLPFIRDPYRFISKRCLAHGSDIFETRFLLEKTVCLTGVEGAKLFYDTSRFHRTDAAPKRIEKTLFGEGGVQGLNGEAHRRRKQLFLDIVSPERVDRLAEQFRVALEEVSAGWKKGEPVEFYDAAKRALMRAVCQWASVPLATDEFEDRLSDVASLYDWAGAKGYRNLAARKARERSENWASDLITKVRNGDLEVPAESALGKIANYMESDGEPLEPRIAAVELLNVLRPTLAVSVYVVFIALALHRYPNERKLVSSGDEEYLEAFAQETRRFFPFFPLVAARAKDGVEWKGFRIPEDRLVLLDLYGINHDERIWQKPDDFNPARFLAAQRCPYSFVPQGGGELLENHRCPGEGVAVAVMKEAARFLTKSDFRYDVPEQDLSVDMKRLPALPKDKFQLVPV